MKLPITTTTTTTTRLTRLSFQFLLAYCWSLTKSTQLNSPQTNAQPNRQTDRQTDRQTNKFFPSLSLVLSPNHTQLRPGLMNRKLRGYHRQQQQQQQQQTSEADTNDNWLSASTLAPTFLFLPFSPVQA